MVGKERLNDQSSAAPQSRFTGLSSVPAAGRIATLIRQALSPEQVVDNLALHKHLSLRHETVYRLIYEDKAACLLQTGQW